MHPEKLRQENQESNEALEPRHASRAVLLDQDGKVAIINVTKHNYYKIPGGGVENQEDLNMAVRREVMEEAGCDCSIIGELGQIKTEMPGWGHLDISQGFIAKVIGNTTEPNMNAMQSRDLAFLKLAKEKLSNISATS